MQVEVAVCDMLLMIWIWEIQQTVVDISVDLKGSVRLDMSVKTLFLVLAMRVVSK